MCADISPTSTPLRKKLRNRKSQLKVVFDTNALYVLPKSLGSASDLVRQEIVSLITEPKYPDLDISWYLPEVVRHEREYQMQTEALRLRGAIDKIERLLGHNLALTDQALVDRVRAKIDEKKIELGLEELALDHKLVDWPAVIHAAEYRIPPFEAGEKEKGFRDAMVAESFLQLVDASPKTPAICRVVLVTADVLLSRAVNARITGSPNAHVLSNIEELRGLINTIVSNVGEEFISQIKPKAAKLFFVSSDDKDTLFYKENVRDQLKSKFGSLLQAPPEGATFREDGTWRIGGPNFSRKEGRRILWTSRIEIELEAGRLVNEESLSGAGYSTVATGLTSYAFPALQGQSVANSLAQYLIPNTVLTPEQMSVGAGVSSVNLSDWTKYPPSLAGSQQKRVVTHKGKDVFEILWSTEITVAKELKKAKIEDIKHIGLSCQSI